MHLDFINPFKIFCCCFYSSFPDKINSWTKKIKNNPKISTRQRGTKGLCSKSPQCFPFIPSRNTENEFFATEAGCNFIASLNFYGERFCLLCFITTGENALFLFWLPEKKGLCPVANYDMGRSCSECRLPLLWQIIPVYSTKDIETL